MTRVPLPVILPSSLSLLPSLVGVYLPEELLMCVFSRPASTRASFHDETVAWGDVSAPRKTSVFWGNMTGEWAPMHSRVSSSYLEQSCEFVVWSRSHSSSATRTKRRILSVLWWGKCCLSASLSETLRTYLFIHYKTLRMRTSSAKSPSNNTARAHWREVLDTSHLSHLSSCVQITLASKISFINTCSCLVYWFSTSPLADASFLWLLWCICHTDYCSAVLQKASSIPERLVTLVYPSSQKEKSYRLSLVSKQKQHNFGKSIRVDPLIRFSSLEYIELHFYFYPTITELNFS